MQPPKAAERPVRRVLHDDVVVDNYGWLRERDDPDVTAYLEAENAYTDHLTAPQSELRQQLFDEIVGRIQETDDSAPLFYGGWWYVTRTIEGQQYPVHVRGATADAINEIVLDENALAGEADYFATGDVVVSPSHNLLAYSVDYDGDERYELRLLDLTDGSELEERIGNLSYGVAWANDETVFYVTADEAHRADRVWRHVVGTPATDDACVFEESDERFWVDLDRCRSGEFLAISSASANTSEVLVIDTANAHTEPRLVEPRSAGHEYRLDHGGERFFIVTNLDAENFRVMECPVDTPGRANWVEVMGHRADTRVEGADAFAGHLVISQRRLALPLITVIDLATDERHELTFDETVYEAAPSRNPEYDTTSLRFGYGSLVTPPSTFDQDMNTGDRTLRKVQPVLGGYETAEYDSARLWATAADGTEVPISLVWRRDMKRPAPCVLYGYGSYEITIPTTFSAARLCLLDRGFVFAIAHVRGGGALGRQWYDHGKLGHKPNTFSDFVACADHLVAERWTTPGQLIIRGASAGGLLVGAVTNARPDLFAAVVAEVPFVDVVNTMLDATVPLTVTEWEQWGNPAEQEAYETIRSYAPYENVRAVPYPAMLVTAGLNDPRVQYWEPAKWVAELRRTTTGERPLLLKTEMGAGHGGPSGRYDAWADEAFVLSFVLSSVGLA